MTSVSSLPSMTVWFSSYRVNTTCVENIKNTFYLHFKFTCESSSDMCWPVATRSQPRTCTQNKSCSQTAILVACFYRTRYIYTNMCKNAHEATLLMLAGRNSRLFVTARYHTLTFGLGKITCEVIMNIYMCFLMNTLRLQWLQLDLHTESPLWWSTRPSKPTAQKTSDNLEVLKKWPKLTAADITVTTFDLVRKAYCSTAEHWTNRGVFAVTLLILSCAVAQSSAQGTFQILFKF